MEEELLNNDNPDYDIPEGWTPLGEVRDAADAVSVSTILSGLGIEYHLFMRSNEVAQIRRCLEDMESGQVLFTRIQDAARALSLVKEHIIPVWVWASVAEYLSSRSTDDLYRVLDFTETWPEPILKTAKHILDNRGSSYPPDGKASPYFPILCFALGASFGVYALIFKKAKIDQIKFMPNGGRRPRYNDSTKRSYRNAFPWCHFLVGCSHSHYHFGCYCTMILGLF